MSRKKGRESPICRLCGSASPIRWGWRYNSSGPKQRWQCKVCSRTFVVDDGFIGKRLPPDAICAAWDLFFRGTSLEDISRHLRVCWSLSVTAPAILEWLRGYSRLLADWAEDMMTSKKVDGGRRGMSGNQEDEAGMGGQYSWLSGTAKTGRRGMQSPC